jgi:hypothetical protein
MQEKLKVIKRSQAQGKKREPVCENFQRYLFGGCPE